MMQSPDNTNNASIEKATRINKEMDMNEDKARKLLAMMFPKPEVNSILLSYQFRLVAPPPTRSISQQEVGPTGPYIQIDDLQHLCFTPDRQLVNVAMPNANFCQRKISSYQEVQIDTVFEDYELLCVSDVQPDHFVFRVLKKSDRTKHVLKISFALKNLIVEALPGDLYTVSGHVILIINKNNLQTPRYYGQHAVYMRTYGLWNKLNQSAIAVGNFVEKPITLQKIEDLSTHYTPNREEFQNMIIYVVSVQMPGKNGQQFIRAADSFGVHNNFCYMMGVYSTKCPIQPSKLYFIAVIHTVPSEDHRVFFFDIAIEIIEKQIVPTCFSYMCIAQLEKMHEKQFQNTAMRAFYKEEHHDTIFHVGKFIKLNVVTIQQGQMAEQNKCLFTIHIQREDNLVVKIANQIDMRLLAHLANNLVILKTKDLTVGFQAQVSKIVSSEYIQLSNINMQQLK